MKAVGERNTRVQKNRSGKSPVEITLDLVTGVDPKQGSGHDEQEQQQQTIRKVETARFIHQCCLG